MHGCYAVKHTQSTAVKHAECKGAIVTGYGVILAALAVTSPVTVQTQRRLMNGLAGLQRYFGRACGDLSTCFAHLALRAGYNDRNGPGIGYSTRSLTIYKLLRITTNLYYVVDECFCTAFTMVYVRL